MAIYRYVKMTYHNHDMEDYIAIIAMTIILNITTLYKQRHKDLFLIDQHQFDGLPAYSVLPVLTPYYHHTHFITLKKDGLVLSHMYKL